MFIRCWLGSYLTAVLWFSHNRLKKVGHRDSKRLAHGHLECNLSDELIRSRLVSRAHPLHLYTRVSLNLTWVYLPGCGILSVRIRDVYEETQQNACHLGKQL